ncbi:MAG: glycoside hydrolase family 38 N-terminal domain-containing protein [Armatimonadota bacterium]
MPMLPGITRPWEVFLVHHTHVDIGYTEPQQVLFRKHAQFIDRALDYITETDEYPEDAQFRWTCEVSWTVKNFLARYPHRAEEFFRRVREGRIEVAGIYLQLTDLFGKALLERALDYAVDLSREHGFQVVTGMNDDVNGWAWGLPAMVATRGMRYLDTAINETRALGVRPRPHPFYWASPGGERVLLWHGNSYLHGSMWESPATREQRMADYLAGLEQSGYPHHAIEVRIPGEGHDNAPPGRWISDFVRDWNDRWEYPRLHFVTARAWFEHLEGQWPGEIPELRQGWPDWWADGNGSALYESALARKAQADLATARAFNIPLDPERMEAAEEAAMLFAEHTWGAWCSTDDPELPESKAQWNVKAGFAYTAAVESSALLRDTAQAAAPKAKEEPAIAVFNPLPFPRTDLVEVLVVDAAIDPEHATWVPAPRRTDEGPAFHLLDVETGERVPVHRTPAIADSARRQAQVVRFIAKNVPAGGWQQYRIVPEPLAVAPQTICRADMLANEHFRLIAGPRGLTSLLNKAGGREMAAKGEYGLGQYIYENIDSPQSREALCEWSTLHYDTPFLRRTPPMRLAPGPGLPFGAGLVLEGGEADIPFLRMEFAIYDDLPRLDIACTVIKPPRTHAEAIYHAFPLAGSDSTVYLDVPGAVLRPGLDQVPGTATDWHSIQRYFAVSDGEWTTVVASPDVPLVQVNGINTGKWQPELPPHNGLVMSWVMNNYWFTNFPAVQGGVIPYRYSLLGYPGPFDAEKSARLADTIRQPLVAVVQSNQVW